jgi:hypothetical protein
MKYEVKGTIGYPISNPTANIKCNAQGIYYPRYLNLNIIKYCGHAAKYFDYRKKRSTMRIFMPDHENRRSGSSSLLKNV